MSCGACVSHTKKALEFVAGVHMATVSLDKQEAVVEHNGANPAELVRAVEEEGYGAQFAV